MKKYIILSLISLTFMSCSSIDTYLKDKNILTINDNFRYNVVNKKNNTQTSNSIKENEIKKIEIRNGNEKIKQQLDELEKKEVITKKEIATPIENKKIEEAKIIQVKQEISTIKNLSEIKFSKTDDAIVQYIAKRVVEKDEQIKRKTIESIKKLREKGIDLTPSQFLSLAFDNIKKTNVNSFILAAARVMNGQEKSKK